MWRLFFGIIEVDGRFSTMKGRRKEVISIMSFVDDEISDSHLNGTYHGDLGHGDILWHIYNSKIRGDSQGPMAACGIFRYFETA